jgi:hypothetical protein
MTDPKAIDAALARRFDYRGRLEAEGLTAWELQLCAEDPVHWLRHWCFTYDPRQPTPSLPFDPFPRQVEFLLWLQARERQQEGGLVEKSRDMGLTWLCCAYALHGWLFRPGFAAGFGSRKLELVDRLGDPDSIFEKIRILLYALPPWMLPEGFDRKEHDNHARLINAANGSSVTGEGGDNIGRGGRKTIYFVDEAAFLERPESVDRALSQTTRVRIDLSTPNGPGNPFARRRHSGGTSVFTFHWRDDPRKSQEWYEKEKERLGDPVTVAQELDIDYTASVEGICIPAAWVRAAVGLELPRGPRVACGLDVGEHGPDPSVLIGRAGPVVLPPVAWGRCNTTETAWRARDEAARQKAVEVCYDAGGVGAGVRGTWDSAEEPLPFRARPVLFGGSPTEDRWPDGQKSKDKFLNLRAEMWWKLRARFERTYEHREKGIHHAPEDLISIPNDPQLITELSLPLAERTETGKIRLESKQRMRARGVKSPSFGDALALAFHAPASEAVELGADALFTFRGARQMRPWIGL